MVHIAARREPGRSASPLKLGVAYPQNELGGDPAALHRFGVAVEQLGYDHLLMYDHVVGAVHGVEREPPLPQRSYHEKDRSTTHSSPSPTAVVTVLGGHEYGAG